MSRCTVQPRTRRTWLPSRFCWRPELTCARVTKRGDATVFAAEYNSNPKAFELLVASGADLNTVNDHGRKLLHAAASNEHPAVVKQLLAPGLDMNARDNAGVTPLHLAASNSGWLEYRGWFLGRSPMPVFPVDDSHAVIQGLLGAGADVEARDDEGRTLLHRAARDNPNPRVLRPLLGAGADLEARNEVGGTPLHRAASKLNPALLRLLLTTGAPEPSAGETAPPHDATQMRRLPTSRPSRPAPDRRVEGRGIRVRSSHWKSPTSLDAGCRGRLAGFRLREFRLAP